MLRDNRDTGKWFHNDHKATLDDQGVADIRGPGTYDNQESFK